MRALDIIRKKRDGEVLSKEEIRFMILGFARDEIPDYQMAAFCMAIFFKGMSEEETADLTLAMLDSGEKIDLSDIDGVKVDKHSTGGVGDTTTLICAPLAASCGVPVPKMSGRGLGHTGGTLDKLESIPGFDVNLSKRAFVEQVNRIGIAVASQTAELVPADKKMYALRDVTATIDSLPLIASSVMSKKLAAGADKIVLDVKYGDGAFMKKKSEALELARVMASIGDKAGKQTVPLLTPMEEPLGKRIGNSLEVEEAIEILRGEGGENNLRRVSVELAAYMILLGRKAVNLDEARKKTVDALNSGKALEKLRELIESQKGNPAVVEDCSLLPRASFAAEHRAPRSGYVHAVRAESVGQAALLLGAGRSAKGERIDRSVGIILKKKVGDTVQSGETLAEIRANDKGRMAKGIEKLAQAYLIRETPVETAAFLLETVGE